MTLSLHPESAVRAAARPEIMLGFPQAGDLEALAGLFADYLAFYGRACSGEAARDFLAERWWRSDSRIIVARRADGGLAGFCQIYPSLSSLAMAPVWVLNDLFVRPDCRRQGIGAALLQHVRWLAMSEGISRLALSTQRGNRGAQSLYERLGWRATPEFLNYELEVAHGCAAQ